MIASTCTAVKTSDVGRGGDDVMSERYKNVSSIALVSSGYMAREDVDYQSQQVHKVKTNSVFCSQFHAAVPH